jgi:hypothetical protein
LNAFTILVVAVLFPVHVMNLRGVNGGKSAEAVEQPPVELEAKVDRRAAEAAFETAANPPRLPDVYYIILDAYARSDVLRNTFDYDNGGFLKRLREKGFYIAARSTSNYCQTALSLSSSLNCRYHDRLAGTAASPGELSAMLRHNAVVGTLKRHGYRFVSYATDYDLTDFPDADLFLAPQREAPRENPFYNLLLDRTPLRMRSRVWISGSKSDTTDSYTALRERTNYVFNTLGLVAGNYSPKFVFAHVVSPHPPFVFGENGEDVSPHHMPYFLADGSLYNSFYHGTIDYVSGYRAQAAYITKRAEAAVTEILRNSAEPPIIILQSDHGSGAHWNCQSADPRKSDVKERLSILNCYYLPGGGNKGLYEDISPVNSFRLIFNNYFGAKLKLLPDRSYLSAVNSRFQFVDVTAQVR